MKSKPRESITKSNHKTESEGSASVTPSRVRNVSKITSKLPEFSEQRRANNKEWKLQELQKRWIDGSDLYSMGDGSCRDALS